MKFDGEGNIKIDRVLSELDIFTVDFLKILKNHTRYVVVSGYVSILLGRARSSEDVDVLIPKLDKKKFLSLVDDLESKGFWCIQAEENNDVFNYFNDGLAVRFAKKGNVIPNIELKPIKNIIDEEALEKHVNVMLDQFTINISNLNLQIAFKEEVLKAPKDIEDARHIRNIAKNNINEEAINEYKRMMHDIY